MVLCKGESLNRHVREKIDQKQIVLPPSDAELRGCGAGGNGAGKQVEMNMSAVGGIVVIVCEQCQQTVV